jgi:hypothetical protein
MQTLLIIPFNMAFATFFFLTFDDASIFAVLGAQFVNENRIYHR